VFEDGHKKDNGFPGGLIRCTPGKIRPQLKDQSYQVGRKKDRERDRHVVKKKEKKMCLGEKKNCPIIHVVKGR